MFSNKLLQSPSQGLLRAYGSIFFAKEPWVGGLFLLATLWFPNTGLAGILAAIVGILTAKLLKFNHLESGLHVYNSLLVGLSLGAYYQLNMHLAVLITLGAVLAVFATVAMRDVMWRLGHVPVLSAPFVIVALTVTLAAHSYGTLERYLLPLVPNATLVNAWVDQFLTALGSAFFTPHPVAGLLLFLGILMTSRYLAWLAISGFICGFSVYSFLSGSPHPDLVAWNGFNFILVAMALGGIFTIPSKHSFILAMVGAVIAALITAASETFMLVYGLPVMALPFLATSLVVLLALTQRPLSSKLQLTLESPMLPEKSFENSRLAIARNGEFSSVPVLPPFYGEWEIYQGFNGAHTHQEPWQHALDFYIVDEGKSFRTDGTRLEDYFCFGLPVLSPVAGFVVKKLDSLPDNKPGEVDSENNWGNHILIRLNNGLYVLLAHLKQASIDVEIGAYVHPGQSLALCGSSGRSPQPHLHLHVQYGDILGGSTHPFHLTTILHQVKEQKCNQFKLFARPREGEKVCMPKVDKTLASSLQLNVGREMRYEVISQGVSQIRKLYVHLNLTGQLRLHSDYGASVAFSQQDSLLSFYNREGSKDAFLDAWLLAVGLTPLNEGDMTWQDRPSMQYLPTTWKQYILSRLFYPMGTGIQSDYERKWHGNQWLQSGKHTLTLPWKQGITLQTQVRIEPHMGCKEILLENAYFTLKARLLEVGQKSDAGIPAWKIET